jgi:hypothetical protein
LSNAPGAIKSPSGINFPTEGCYEITGQSGDAQLTFVTKVAAPAANP